MSEEKQEKQEKPEQKADTPKDQNKAKSDVPKEQPKVESKQESKEQPKEASKDKAEAKPKQKQSSKIRKKIWYSILAPKLFKEQPIGETCVYEKEAMIGKTINENLMSLTSDVKRQSVTLKFEVDKVENNKARTKLISYRIIPATVKRLVRRNSKKIDLSFSCTTADSVRLRIKPILVTRSKTSNSILNKMRNTTVEFITKTIKSAKFDEVVNQLIQHKIQSTLRTHLKKLYPLKTCEIRFAGVQNIDTTKLD